MCVQLWSGGIGLHANAVKVAANTFVATILGLSFQLHSLTGYLG